MIRFFIAITLVIAISISGEFVFAQNAAAPQKPEIEKTEAAKPQAEKQEADSTEKEKSSDDPSSLSTILDFALKQLDNSPQQVRKDLEEVAGEVAKEAKAIKGQIEDKGPIVIQDLQDEFGSRLKDLPKALPQMIVDRSVLPIWSDEIVFHDLRVQMNCRNGECRLIDESQKVLASGKLDDCHKELTTLRTSKKLPALKKHVVLLLHGLGRTSQSLNDMAAALRKNKDWEVISLGYPSGEADVAAHAKSLANVISHLDGAEQIDLVAHSLGNIVIRHYWADQTDPATKKTPDTRIKRIVMVGPPNKGAVLAQKYGANKLYENFAGMSGRQLTRGWGDLEKKLATPTCEFGIIAGGKSDDIGFNPLIPGDDDLLVTVEETKLAGARDFLLLPITHAGQMRRPEVQAYVRTFLENGYFVSERDRHPIAEAGVEKTVAEKAAEKLEKTK